MTKLSDTDIRRIAQERGYYFAGSRTYGPAHIVDHYNSLCGSAFYDRCVVKANDLCGNCRRIAAKKFEVKP